MKQPLRAAALLCCVWGPATAHAGDAMQDLPSALNDLARRSGIALVFDPAQVGGTRVRPTEPPADARAKAAPPAVALAQLLADTRFTYRQVDAHAFVIVDRALRVPGQTDRPAPSAGPEIMVTGRLSQNVDLVRGIDEVQPYQVASAEDIAASGQTTLDDFFRVGMTLDRSPAPLAQTGNGPGSEINLRGLGADQTLVLVDGHRMAGVLAAPGQVGQIDINAIPIEAVDRVEVLASSAGGIFGIGATGGAVNIILKHDYHGLMLAADNMVTEQGDGVQWRVYGRAGWQTHDGRTSVMVSGSWARDDGLLQGDRPYAEAARVQRVGDVGYTDSYVSNGINIRSTFGTPLSFAPAYGGAALGSAITYLPLGSAAPGSSELATLAANAGRQDLTLAGDGQGDRHALVGGATRTSLMANLHQDIGDSTQLSIDYLRLDDRGIYNVSRLGTEQFALAPGSAGNPFAQTITVSFPTTLPAYPDTQRNFEQRVTVGLVRRFAGGWSVAADGAYSITEFSLGAGLDYALGRPQVFGGSAALAASLAPLAGVSVGLSGIERLADANLRASGPLVHLPGGMATVSLSGEFRHEWSAGFTTNESVSEPGSTFVSDDTTPPATQDTWSALGEMRLPFLPEAGGFAPWRGLTGQVALRFDHYALRAPDEDDMNNVYSRGGVLAATAGLRARPVDSVMLRASVSTAATPPSASQLVSSTFQANLSDDTDPQRGNTPLPTNVRLTEGNPALRPQHTVSLSGGVVIEPVTVPGLRASVDYTALSTHHEIFTIPADEQYLIDNESAFPGAVVRAPLTAADRAAGYTGGQILAITNGPQQLGHSLLQTLDFALADTIRAGSGRVTLRADTDWTLAFRRVANPLEGAFELVGHADGPLAWRSNLSAEWADPHWTLRAQAQLYAGYSLGQATPPDPSGTGLSLAQIEALIAREPRVPVQDYFDLSIAFRPAGKTGVQIRLTVDNVFNKAPPLAVSTLPTAISGLFDVSPLSNVANYGDVLGRRLAMNVTIPLRW